MGPIKGGPQAWKWFTSETTMLQNVTQEIRPEKDNTKMDIKIIRHYGVSWG
jgi:hypothetical protein